MRLFRRRKPIPKAAVRLWLSDTTGALRPAVESYLAGGSMRSADVAEVRDYLREWIVAPGWFRTMTSIASARGSTICKPLTTFRLG
jgi:hypothetical protein